MIHGATKGILEEAFQRGRGAGVQEGDKSGTSEQGARERNKNGSDE